MNYLQKYGLTSNPFIKNNSADIKLELNNYKQLIFRLNNLLDTKGLAIITGEPGLGKTTSVRFLVDTLNKNLYKIIYVKQSTLSIYDFYKEI